jgi:hypothetical protein
MNLNSGSVNNMIGNPALIANPYKKSPLVILS